MENKQSALTNQLTKNTYSGCNQSSLISTTGKSKADTTQQKSDGHKPLICDALGIEKEPMSSPDTGLNHHWTGLDSNTESSKST